MFKLTERETEILELMTKGYNNSEIGKILCISKHTVKACVSAIIRKTDARSRSQVTYLAGINEMFSL